MEYAVEVEALSKQFLPERRPWRFYPGWLKEEAFNALHQVSLKVAAGTLFCLLGPNKSGKTTLLKIISTLILPSSGKVTVLGYDLRTRADEIKKHIGVISGEERSFYWRLSGRDNLEFWAALYGMSRTESARRIAELVELLHLQDDIERRFYTYSTGMKQRFCIARGLLPQPRLIMMDEPTRGLDVSTLFLFQELLDYLKARGCTVIIASHQLGDMERRADSFAVLHKGRLKAAGDLAGLRAGAALPEASLEDIYYHWVGRY
jgi:ABC-type multidrug transport system ATPase subunit